MGRKKIRNGETIQFRPGEQLGDLLDGFASAFSLSRNEAARRLLHLAIRGLPLELYPYLAELQTLMFEPSDFGDACHELVVELNSAASATSKAPVKRAVEDIVQVVQQRIDLLRAIRGVTEEAEKAKVYVYVSREG